MYQSRSLQLVLDLLQTYGTLGITQLSRYSGKGRAILHRYVKALLAMGIIQKIWSSPHTVYRLTNNQNISPPVLIDPWFQYLQNRCLDEYFWKLSPSGKIYQWVEGFVTRCQSRGLDPHKKIDHFCQIASYLSDRKSQNPHGLIDVTSDVHGHILDSALDQMYYADQYKRMEFGRGKTAEITFYAKDTQNLKLIWQSIALIIRQLQSLIYHSTIDAIAFIPHSRKRNIQLLKELQKNLRIWSIPQISYIKYAPHGIVRTQKSITSRADRISNARDTILLNHPWPLHYQTVLLIDDFVWSGATLNESAKKLKHAGVQTVIWFAFVGNINMKYDVINEI
jgi:hypothetical protein